MNPTSRKNPLFMFRLWVDQAPRSEGLKSTTMKVSAAGAEGSNQSRKAEARRDPRGALLFCRGTLVRVVRIEGDTLLLSDEESDAYFGIWSHLARPKSDEL